MLPLLDWINQDRLPLNRRDDARRRALLRSTKADIAKRLVSVCAYMAPADFDNMLEEMAALEIKYTLRRNAEFFDRMTFPDLA